MDKFDPTNNKIGDSFEKHFPQEDLPNFIWDNILNKLNEPIVPIESTSKIKDSFEEAVEHEVAPILLWDDIVGELDASSTLSPDERVNNRIKDSFETELEGDVPKNLWSAVENQLEIETVWKRLNKALQQRTQRRYWREKATQFGLVCLALFWLRGCDFGFNPIETPAIFMATESTQLVHSKEVSANKLLENKEAIVENKDQDSKIITLETANKNYTTAKNNIVTTKEKIVTKEKKRSTKKRLNTPSADNKQSSVLLASNNNTSDKTILLEENLAELALANPTNLPKEEHLINNLSTNNSTPITEILKEESTQSIAEENSSIGVVETANAIPEKEKNINELPPVKGEVEPAILLTNVAINDIIINNNNKENNPVLTEETASVLETTNVAATEAENPQESIIDLKAYVVHDLDVLLGGPIADSSIQQTNSDFVIEQVVVKKTFHARFELGLIGKVGTSLLLGKETSKALETTSMLKTNVRPAGLVGVQLAAFLTKDDAIVLSAAPFSSHQQYFGGYTQEGRFYNKEIKLNYFDFSIAYQRVLFHYNDFGNIPSTMYARLEYGLGYLNKSEEIINGAVVEVGDSYNKINHQVGLSVGNTHQIKRIVIDYGLYANMGVNSTQNHQTAVLVEQRNLMNFGGYFGLRYMIF